MDESTENLCIQDRINHLIQTAGLSQTKFSKELGLESGNTIGNIVGRRRNQPSFMILELILQTFEWLSAEWLMRGKGPMSLVKNTNYNLNFGEKSQFGALFTKNSGEINGTSISFEDSKQFTDQMEEKIQTLTIQNEGFKELIKSKDEIIKSKDELIKVLQK